MPPEAFRWPRWDAGALSTRESENANCVRSRLLRGISNTLRSSIKFVTVAVVVSTCEASPVMVTDWVTSPTGKTKSTTAFRPTVNVMPLRMTV